MVLTSPYVPEVIVVHLGAPAEAAANVTVSYADYIKNVACSEIYPTWPEAALRANIYAQLSFTQNRLFTEWYRSQGYDFDITSSTQYDHSFVYGRTIFENISYLVDELFTSYLRKSGQVAPFPAPYCDGWRTLCDGLRQWGSVDLAGEGYNSIEILRYYYGEDIEIVSNTPVRSATPSYPGVELEYGDYSNYVLIIQYQLNRIAGNYPSLPKIDPATGDFDLITLAAVRRFQNIFDLEVSGVVDEATWYRISYIYSVVKRLAELETEGMEYSSFTRPLPDTVGVGYDGEGVDLIQYFLSVIGLFNPEFPEVEIRGVYDAATERAVMALQESNGLPVTGEVDIATWNLLYDQFRGITFVVPELGNAIPIVAYNGVVLRRGSSGERVELLQRYLNAVAAVYTDVPTVDAIGIFGPQTFNAVWEFQGLFALTQDGIVGERTWQMLLDVYESTLRRVNPDVPQYPGFPITEGMSD